MTAQLPSNEQAHALAKQIYLGLDPRYPDRWYDHIVSVLTPTGNETCDQRDAERYRQLRKGNDYKHSGPMVVLCETDHMESDERPFWVLSQSALDEAVDKMRRSEKAKLGASFPKPWTMGGNLVGTHRVGFAPFSYSRIVEVFGEPTETDFSEGSRTAFNWTITFADGTIAAIYEYKRSSLYGDGDDAPTPEEMKRSFTDWHIGGKSQRAVELVNKALSAGE